MTGRGAWTAADGLRLVAVALLLVEGAIHLQQVEGPLNAVPTINTLFALNAAGAAAIALVLAGSRGFAAVLGSLAALGLTIGALVSLAISRAGTIFQYSEPTLRSAVVLAAVVELAVVLALAAFLLARRRESHTGSGRVDWTARYVAADGQREAEGRRDPPRGDADPGRTADDRRDILIGRERSPTERTGRARAGGTRLAGAGHRRLRSSQRAAWDGTRRCVEFMRNSFRSRGGRSDRSRSLRRPSLSAVRQPPSSEIGPSSRSAAGESGAPYPQSRAHPSASRSPTSRPTHGAAATHGRHARTSSAWRAERPGGGTELVIVAPTARPALVRQTRAWGCGARTPPGTGCCRRRGATGRGCWVWGDVLPDLLGSVRGAGLASCPSTWRARSRTR